MGPLAHQDFDGVLPMAGGHVMGACANSPEQIGIRPGSPRHHLHTGSTCLDDNTFLAIAGEVENAAQSALQIERLTMNFSRPA